MCSKSISHIHTHIHTHTQVEKVGAEVVECACVVEVAGLGGRDELAFSKRKLFTVIEDFMEADAGQMDGSD